MACVAFLFLLFERPQEIQGNFRFYFPSITMI